LCSGSRWKKLRTTTGEREKQSECPKLCAENHIIKVQQTEGEEEDITFSPVIEEPLSLVRVESWFEKTTSWTSPEFDKTFKDLSRVLVVIKGSQSRNN
jgi:hypothetical protein